MTISCDTAKTLTIVFGVYSGILTGVLLGFFLLWCLKRKKTIPKAKKTPSSGIDNAGFAETGLGVTPERLREDLSAQRRNRQDATPIPSRRESSPKVVTRGRPSVAESYHSATVEPDSGITSRPVTYLELEAGGHGTGVAGAGEEFASLKSSESASTLYDDVQSIGSKSKTSLREARNSVSSANAVFYDIYDDISVQVQVLEVRKSSNPQDLEDARKSYQEAPEKYRKSSNYIDLDSKSSSPAVKKDIEKMISTLGEESSSSSDSSSSSVPETFQRRKSSYSNPSSEVENEVQDSEVFSIHTDPISIDNLEDEVKVQNGKLAPLRRVANVDLGSSIEHELEGNLSDSGSSDADSSDEDGTTTSGSETLDEADEVDHKPSKLKPDNALEILKGIEPEMIELKQAIELDLEPEEPKIEHFEPALEHRPGHPNKSDSRSSSSSSSEDEPETIELKQAVELDLEPEKPKLEQFKPIVEHRPEHATQVLDQGHEVHLCTPAVIRTDDDSSSEIIEVKQMTKVQTEGTSESYESSTESGSSTEESSSSESSEEEEEPKSKVAAAKLERKSSSSSSSKLSKSSKNELSKKTSSSSSSSSSGDEHVQSNGFDHNLYANLPPIQRNAKSLSLPSPNRNSSSSSESKSSSSKPRKMKKRSSDISDSFLRNLNRNYQPVYYLRKVNSETQTDKGSNKETEA